MLLEIFRFEIVYRLRRTDTYLYFMAMFLFALVGVDFLFEGKLSPVMENAPYVIAYTMAVLSAILMMITSMIMGVAALRDFDHHMESIMFVNPIKKIDYLMGRFCGSFVILVLINSGLLLGLILGQYMPWRDPANLLPFDFWYFLQPFLFVVLPSLFFGGAIFFVSGALSRNLLVVYTQGILFFVAYIGAMVLARGKDGTFWAAILDPFSFQTINTVVQYWTTDERNAQLLPIEGLLLYNRLAWIALGLVVMVVGHYAFSFHVVRAGWKKPRAIQQKTNEDKAYLEVLVEKARPLVLEKGFLFDIVGLIHQSIFFFKLIVKDIPFWAIVLCGVSIIFINSISLDTYYGVDAYPATYIIVEELQELSIFFFLIILIFYSGELIWKDRHVGIHLMMDALPNSDFVNLAGKFIGLVMAYLVLIIALVFSGVLFQTLAGYNQYEWHVYATGFLLEILPFLVLYTFMSFFFQVCLNHKSMGHIATVVFFIGTVIMEPMGFDHGLYRFGGGDLGMYSEMNGYGHFWTAYGWFKGYWFSFVLALFMMTCALSLRGTETYWKTRLKLARLRFTKSYVRAATVMVLLFVISGSYIFFNTNILNQYTSMATQNAFKADYEKTLKKYERTPQPKMVDVSLKVELYPSRQEYSVYGNYTLVNKHDVPIHDVHVQGIPTDQIEITSIEFDRPAIPNYEYEYFSHNIYHLKSPMMPGDSIKMEFTQTFTTKGFIERSGTRVVENGTFLDNFHFPRLGYEEHIEIRDKYERIEFGLAERPRISRIDDTWALNQGKAGDDGEEIYFEIILGTDKDQIAVAPGYLLDEWAEEGRQYYHYKMDIPMSNFYAIVSGRYEVMKDQWIPKHDSLGTPVELEIFYHKGHEYNLNRMMKAMKKSFDYYTAHFGPYQYRQMRILEFPRYKQRAQSFPNTVPFSENSGFVMDVNDDTDVDMPFFITAHEVAHQWWGHQVNAADVQGQSAISESLAQYSALMVFREEYPVEKVQQLLQAQKEKYLKGRAGEKIDEMPLSLVESGQSYIHYGKGIINLNLLQNYVSEDSVNVALRRFIRDWKSEGGLLQDDRYATTRDLLSYFGDVTPDSLSYLIDDLFHEVVSFENRVVHAKYLLNEDRSYTVNFETEVLKYRLDSLGRDEILPPEDYIDIAIYTVNESGDEEVIYSAKHLFKDKSTTLSIAVPQKPVKVVLDPLKLLIEKRTDDNVGLVRDTSPL